MLIINSTRKLRNLHFRKTFFNIPLSNLSGVMAQKIPVYKACPYTGILFLTEIYNFLFRSTCKCDLLSRKNWSFSVKIRIILISDLRCHIHPLSIHKISSSLIVTLESDKLDILNTSCHGKSSRNKCVASVLLWSEYHGLEVYLLAIISLLHI